MRLFRHIHNDLRRTFAERIDIFHRNRYGNLLHQFQITAFDEAGEIGRCTHQRALVNAQRFLEKAYDKL